MPSKRPAINSAPHSGKVGTSVAALLATGGGAGAVTTVVCDALLFAVFKSATSEVTLALLLILPGVVFEDFTVTLKLVLAAERMVPSAQVKLEPLWLQITDELTKLVPTGSVLVTTTLVAACGPAF